MNTKNELVAQIEMARSRGAGVKSIRRQKFDPNNFYMSLTDNKQVGPVKVDGDLSALDRKFNEAQAYLSELKSNAAKRAA